MCPSLLKLTERLTELDAHSLGKPGDSWSTHHASLALRLLAIIVRDAHGLGDLQHAFSDTR